MSKLDKIEKRIRDFFESNPLFILWAGNDDHVVRRLSEALQELFLTQTPREFVRPVFHILLNPDTAAQWQSQTNWEEKLTDLLVSSASEFGFHFLSKPEVLLKTDPSLTVEEIHISLRDTPYPPGGETGVIAFTSSKGDDLQKTAKPTLILQDGKTIELSQPVINIGRKSSNHIIINDLRVSRVHAQLRKVKEVYMIFDVGSTGGTFINSTRIGSHALRPGDVISLGGFTMIYAIDQSPLEETQNGITSKITINEENEED